MGRTAPGIGGRGAAHSDGVEQHAAGDPHGHAMHGRPATMLSDPKLKAIEQFGCRNRNLNNFKTPGRPGLPVPTTLLADASGKVVWKGQSDNYTRRSHPSAIRAALGEHFPSVAIM